VTLLDNLVHGFVWATNKRPDRLHVRRNNFNLTFPAQWNYLQEVCKKKKIQVTDAVELK
jgi:hypothetical protein